MITELFCGNHDDYQSKHNIIWFRDPCEEKPHIGEPEQVAQGNNRDLFVNSRIDHDAKGKEDKIESQSYPERIIIQQFDLFYMQ
jgi:hypothetical protein